MDDYNCVLCNTHCEETSLHFFNALLAPPVETQGVFSWGGKNFLVSHRICRKNVGRGFWILINKQITEPIRKLRDESNDTN